MTDLNYYAVSPDQQRLRHRGGLIAWGVVAIVVGALYVLGGVVASVAVVFIVPRLAPTAGRSGPSIAATAAGLLITFGLGVSLIWLGIGCCRGRRWTAPLLVAGGWVALVGGILAIGPTLLFVGTTLSGVTRGVGVGPPQELVLLVTTVLSLIFWFGLSVVLIVWFGRPTVAQTLATLDPHVRWTDGVSRLVLAWVVVCVWYGLTIAIAALAGVHLWFATVLHGPAAFAISLIGLAIVVAGYGSYRGSTLAGVTAVGLFALMSASAAVFAIAGDSTAYYRQLLGNFTPASRAAAVGPRPGTTATTGPTSGPIVTTTTVSVVPTFNAPAFDRINPGVGPALIYTAAAGFGLFVLPRLGRHSAHNLP